MKHFELNSCYLSSKRSYIFTDIDLDGAMSYMLFRWMTNKSLPYITTRITDFRKSFTNWLKNHSLDDYEAVYILDLDVSSECMDVVDHPNVVIIDHHESHVRNKDKYKKAKTFIELKSSCSKYIYELFGSTLSDKLTVDQKRLVLLVDDYDSYTLKLDGSDELNLLFWNYQGDKLNKFIKEFDNGFVSYTKDQQKIISFYKKKRNNVINDLEVYEANIPIAGHSTRIIATFASTSINEVADHIIKKYKGDVGIVVNSQSNKISFRKSKSCKIDLSKLAKTLAKGGGHKYAAGGMLCDEFNTFSKLLTVI